MLLTLRHILLLKDYLQITESFQQKFAWVYEEIRNKQVSWNGWSSLVNSNISNQYTLTVRNKFDTLKETSERHTPSYEYENFVINLIEAAAECITTKPGVNNH